MEREKVVRIAEKVKALAGGFIGICFTSMGATYFEPQAIYRVPRILLPVYESLGNVGLAIGMIILGLSLIAYGFINWKKVSTKPLLYFVIAVPLLALSIYLAFTVDAFKDSSERMTPEERREALEDRRDAQIEQIKQMDKPTFKNSELNAHLAEFDGILKNYKEKVQAEDEQGIIDTRDAFYTWLSHASELGSSLESTDDKVTLAHYIAQLSLKWQESQDQQ